MARRSVAEVTQLLQAWGDGDEHALYRQGLREKIL
jgi:hypothetical protein